ncbi:MAG: hypothetical protein GY759_22020 [Chloroflexi bacterium]|nr:hypothetical protein [Chloroflexota bacterium]
MARYRSTLTLLLYVLIYASVAARGLSYYYEQRRDLLWIIGGLLLIYGVLLISERRITRRVSGYSSVYLAVQTGVILALLILSPLLDYFALLFIPLCVQAMLAFPRNRGYFWVGVFALATALGLVISYGLVDALPFIFIYAAAYLFVASYAAMTRQAEEAQEKSEGLLAQLQEAHVQLQEYATQAEELAVLEERNRLARDLHDSVTQSLYSLTLYAEAASRQLAAGAYDVVGEHLRELRKSAQQSLQEMRLLIFELRPSVLEELGLETALRSRLEAVETRAGLKATLTVSGEGALPPEIEVGLYRITQEALNIGLLTKLNPARRESS